MSFITDIKTEFADSEVDVRERYRLSAKETSDGVAVIYYDIYKGFMKIGYMDLRSGDNPDLYYFGNVGYHIYSPYRGHHYCYEACLKLFEIAKKEGMDELIITCSPSNIASYKTLLKLNGEFIETVAVPPHHELYKRGETIKCIFKYKL